MYPELFNIGPFTIHTYGVLFALGILSAVFFAEHLYRRSGGKPGEIMDLAGPVVLGIVLGARLLFILVNLDYFSANPGEILKIWTGGLVFYGGLIGGAAAFIITARLRNLDLWKLADSTAPGVALGHAIGRLGCLFAGSCYGKPTDLPWAIVFNNPGSLARDILGIPVHPTQLYSFLFLLILSGFLALIHSRKRFGGQVIASYGIIYGIYRFLAEFLRGDPRGTVSIFGFTLSTSQTVSLFLVPIAVVLFLFLYSRKDPEESL